MIDATLVIRKINLISKDFGELARLAQKSLDEYLGSSIDQALAERYLERAIGRMIDINYHLITESGHAPPTDYFASFVQLGPLGILPPPLARQIAVCAGLRNRIVHEYDELDPHRLHEGLQATVRDIPPYLARIHEYIQGLPA